jgi:hypothetical protein
MIQLRIKILFLACFFDSQIDANLKLVIEAWQQLSPELKQAIVKMVC